MAGCKFSDVDKARMESRYRQAQLKELAWEEATSPATLQVITAYSKCKACPREFFFMPLLTLTGAMLGVQTSVAIKPMWKEPAILWTAILAKKGRNKSAAMGFLNEGLLRLQEDVTAEWQKSEEGKEQEGEPPKLKVTSFSFERLHEVMLENNNEMLALYDELELIFGLLARGCDTDRRQLLSLEGGGEWSRDFKVASGMMAHTAFNMAGFVQPFYIMSRYLADNHDGLMDRLLVSCPQRLKVYWESLRSDNPRHIPDPHLLFTILRAAHPRTEGVQYVYSLDNDAQQTFGQFYNYLEDEIDNYDNDEDRQSLLSKMKGKVARIAMVLTALEQAAEFGIMIQANKHQMSSDDVTLEWENFSQQEDDDKSSTTSGTTIQSMSSNHSQECATRVQDESLINPSGYNLNIDDHKDVVSVKDAVSRWKFIISKYTMEQAIVVGKYFLEQHFALMPLPAIPLIPMPDVSTEGVNKEKVNLERPAAQKLLIKLLNMGSECDINDIVRKRSMPALKESVNDKGFNKKACCTWLASVEAGGFGKIQETERLDTRGRKVKKLVWKRTPFTELCQSAKELLQKAGLDNY